MRAYGRRGWLYVKVLDVLGDWVRVLKLATKPSREEYKLTLRVVLLGLGILGTMGFFFQLAGSMLEFASIQAIPREYALLGGLVVGAVIFFIALYLRSRSEL
ncbi:SecE/sec61-gamma family protein translocase subunit [Infirmifilum sp. SLHALR2]